MDHTINSTRIALLLVVATAAVAAGACGASPDRAAAPPRSGVATPPNGMQAGNGPVTETEALVDDEANGATTAAPVRSPGDAVVTSSAGERAVSKPARVVSSAPRRDEGPAPASTWPPRDEARPARVERASSPAPVSSPSRTPAPQAEPVVRTDRDAGEPVPTDRDPGRGAARAERSAPTSQEPGEDAWQDPVSLPAPPVEPVAPVPQFELTVPADAAIGLQVETGASSETARVEDRVDARVTRDVRVAGRVAIPVGARVEGSVVRVNAGGRFKEKARLDVRFHTLVLADGTRVPLRTDALVREGASPTRDTAAKVGGAAAGAAILGAILGGGKGAAIGGAVGAAGGTAAVMAGGRNPATLPAGSTITVRLTSPAAVTVDGDRGSRSSTSRTR